VYAYPELVRRIREPGHELGHHGWVHENPQKFDRDGERRNLERGFEAFDKVVGERPRGYRSPAWDFSQNTIDLLREFGFEYDPSCMGNDLYPTTSARVTRRPPPSRTSSASRSTWSRCRSPGGRTTSRRLSSCGE
jgi:peptidoglycan/xylan/chitin deacetylase (PgdA/CDA1 family)